MFGNPLTPQEILQLAQQSVASGQFGPVLPNAYVFATPPNEFGAPAFRLFDAAYITTGIIDPNRLGTGATGAGNLYLADDGTWKPVSGGGGAVDRIIAGTNISISPTGGTGNVTINATTLVPDPTGYGSFYSTQNQSLAAIDTPQIVTFNNTYEANDVSLSSNRIYFAKAGTYQFAYVAQIFNSSNDIEHCEFWIKYNGVDFPNSATHITVQARKSASEPSEQQMKLILSGTAQNDGDYIELYWQGSTTSLQLGYVAPGVDGPVGSPSVIANIIPIGAQGRDSNLNELNDVLITSPLNGQLLRYDNADQRWENWTPNFLTAIPTLDQVTTAGNTTTNAITVGGLNLSTNVGVTSSSAFGLNYIEFNALTATQGISALFKPATGSTGYAYDFEFRKDRTTYAGLLIIGGNASAGGGTANKNIIAVDNSGSRSDWLAFRVAASNSSWGSATDLVSLTHTQNVLIGTTTDAGYKLDVNGTARIQNSFLVNGPSTFTDRIYLGDSGADTDTNYYIQSGGQIYIQANAFKANNFYTDLFLQSGTTSVSQIQIRGNDDASGFIRFTVNNTEAARFFNNGDLVIGTTSDDGYKLNVNGVIAATGGTSTNWNTAYGWGNHATAGYLTSQPWVTSGSNIYYNTGNVGIGTTTPSDKLSVVGTVAATGYKINGNVGWTGIIFIATNPPGQQNITVEGGLITGFGA